MTQPNPNLPPEGAPHYYSCLAALIAQAVRRIQATNMAKEIK